MAIFGFGIMVGPIIGPSLGGYLTEPYNWRYVFYVNVPFGVLAVIGLLLFLPSGDRLTPVRAAGDIQGPQLRPRRADGAMHRHRHARQFRPDGPLPRDPSRLPVEAAGWSMAPGGIGTTVGMQLASMLSNRINHRKIMAFGLTVLGTALHAMSDWTPDVSQRQMVVSLLLQGFGIGFVFNPMTVIALAPCRPRFAATPLRFNRCSATSARRSAYR